MVLVDLRYSTRNLTEAAKERRRPQPGAVRRRVDAYSYARSIVRDRSVSRLAWDEERRTRQRLRAELGLVQRQLNARTDGRPAIARTDIPDIVPARHRHSALRLA
ncbi:hypothetical protein [Kitasatospora sp. NBC_01266]|uniref:hypothetical protein n=1 Tax=Kitasatospora sp. NBC_01266 TaxID=2903572 RepID=UPI002E32F5C5|nr:hypothetical protein [Kitasatospora sp. NBC_01266]